MYVGPTSATDVQKSENTQKFGICMSKIFSTPVRNSQYIIRNIQLFHFIFIHSEKGISTFNIPRQSKQ